MQTILNNLLASPFTLGICSAMAFGAALTIVPGTGFSSISELWFISANEFIFALLAALLLDGITRWTNIATSGVILFGIAQVLPLMPRYQCCSLLPMKIPYRDWSSGRWVALLEPHEEKVGTLLLILAFILPLSLMSIWKLTALGGGPRYQYRTASWGRIS